MSLESPIFDNIYIAAGVAGLLVVLLILMLVTMRRRRKSEAATWSNASAPSMPDDLSSGATSPYDPAFRPPAALPMDVAPATMEQPPPLAPGPPLEHPPVGDPVAAMVISLLEDPGDLTDTSLRRLELFKPERVLAVIDGLGQSLSGRGKEAKRVRLATIRQYAQSLQLQLPPTQMAAQTAAPSPIPAPPPGSGTAVHLPEAWGSIAEAAAPIPLDRELSYLDEPAEPSTLATVADAAPSSHPMGETPPPPAQPPPVPLPSPTPPSPPPPTDDAFAWGEPPEPTPEPPPAFGPGFSDFPAQPTGPETLEQPSPPPLPQAPPAYVIRETTGVTSPGIAEDGRIPGGSDEEWERPAIVERDTLEEGIPGVVWSGADGPFEQETLRAGPRPAGETLSGISEPGAPPEVEPGAPPEVEPGAPPEVEPGAPPEVEPGAPPARESEPAATPETMTLPELAALPFTSADTTLKMAAVDRLQELGSPEALNALDAYLDDPDAAVLMHALEAAERLLARLEGH